MNAVTQSTNKRGTSSQTISQKRNEWLKRLYADESNCIGFQVYTLTADFLDWWTINEARCHTPRNQEGQIQASGLLHGLLNRCFYKSLMVAIRKLCDTTKGTWSLHKLLEDMKNNSEHLTRRAVFDAEGVPYDLACLERKRRRLREDGPEDYEAEIEIQCNHARSKKRHEQWDYLTDKTADTRSEDDNVSEKVFADLQKRLEKNCERIKKHVNEFIAHASSPTKRGIANNQIKLVTLLNAVLRVKRVFDFVSGMVVPRPESNGSHVSKGEFVLGCVECYDPLEYLECPLVLKSDLPKVREVRDRIKERLGRVHIPRTLRGTKACADVLLL